MTAHLHPAPELTPPACGPTTARLQAVLDGDLPAAALAADPHAVGCETCRSRVRAARLLMSAYPARPALPVVPSGLADSVLLVVRADRQARTARRVAGVAVGLAAAVALAVWSPWKAPSDRPEVVNVPPVVEPGPAVPAVRIGAELAKAGDALKESSRPWTGPTAAAPRLFAVLTGAVSTPAVAPPPSIEPARLSLAELPDAARTGLEPVTGSAQKAWNRLLRDVGAVSAKPKS